MINQGCVIRSAAGHDMGRFFIVLKIEGDFAYICDGKYRGLLNPKKKRIKHIKKTNTVLNINELKTDKQIRNALHCFNYGEEQINSDIPKGGNLLV